MLQRQRLLKKPYFIVHSYPYWSKSDSELPVSNCKKPTQSGQVGMKINAEALD
jgi:hypothetical protein